MSISGFKFDPRIMGVDLSWDEFQATLADEFAKFFHSDPLVSDSDDSEYTDPTVLDVLLSPADALAFCEHIRTRLNCNPVDGIILRILWNNRKAIDGGEFY